MRSLNGKVIAIKTYESTTVDDFAHHMILRNEPGTIESLVFFGNITDPEQFRDEYIMFTEQVSGWGPYKKVEQSIISDTHTLHGKKPLSYVRSICHDLGFSYLFMGK